MLLKIHDVITWQQWFQSTYGPHGHHDLGGPHHLDTPTWKVFLSILPTFRKHTSVIIGDGSFTSFWSDHLIGSAPLELTIQALFSHALRPNISVRSAAENGHWGLHLQPRLTLLAQQELSTLLQALQDVQLSPAVPDRRGIRMMLMPFSTKLLYHALSPVALEYPLRSTVITCILWSIWKAMNARVFEQMDKIPSMVLRQAAEELQL
ncbi:hypothetical protein SETIT_2G046300v2 [Setaria italica]|uniref:Uncharacterized protein n=1 Tax=Setaria italica TaxID=4555 RepID=A0A368PV37_SETIT|nr:hypothetical protein SETIT_2G046300v2 [Setaria italica]